MVGLGTLVNSGAILAGAVAGLLLRRGLPEKWQESIMQGVALCIIVIGVQMASAYIGTTFIPPIFGLISEKAGMFIYPFFIILLAFITLVSTEYVGRTVKK